MRVFGGDKVKRLMGTFKIPEDQPIEMKMLSRQLESAQTRIEGFHFDSRKQILAYDDVLNQQRTVVYNRRNKLLHGDEAEIQQLITEVIQAGNGASEVIEKKKAELGEDVFPELFRRISLQVIDTLWVEHLEVMSYTRNSVNLRAYGQRDPLIEYRKEGKRLFNEMQAALAHRIMQVLPRVQADLVAKEEERKKQERAKLTRSDQGSARSTAQTPVVKNKEYGRNDLVVVAKDGEQKELKYKKAEPLLADGWQIVNSSQKG